MNRERIIIERGKTTLIELDSTILIQNIRIQVETPISMKDKRIEIKLSSNDEIPSVASQQLRFDDPNKILNFELPFDDAVGWKIAKMEVKPIDDFDSEIALSIVDESL